MDAQMIVVARIDHLKALGFEWPWPSFVSAIPSMLFSWLSDMPEGEKYQLIGEMYFYDLSQKLKSHTNEYQVTKIMKDYYERS